MEKEKEEKLKALRQKLNAITKEVNAINHSLDNYPPIADPVNREEKRRAKKFGEKIQKIEAKIDKLNAEGEAIVKKIRDLEVI